MVLEFIILTIIIIVLHVQAGLVWEMYYRQEEARKKEEIEDKQNSEEIVNANTRTFAIWDAEQVSEGYNNEQDK